MGAYSKRDDKSTANVTNLGTNGVSYADADRTTLGLGADYALSKRTAVYFRYQAVDPNTNRSGMNSTATASTTTAGSVTAAGVATAAGAVTNNSAATINSQSSFDKVTTMAVGIRHSF